MNGKFEVFVVNVKSVFALFLLLFVFIGVMFYLLKPTHVHVDYNQQIAHLEKLIADNKKVTDQFIAEDRKEVEMTQNAILDLVKLHDELQKELKNSPDHERLLFLGTLMNENLAAIQQRKLNDIIFIERNWKINRMPRFLDMSKEDIEWLEQFIEKSIAESSAPRVVK